MTNTTPDTKNRSALLWLETDEEYNGEATERASVILWSRPLLRRSGNKRKHLTHLEIQLIRVPRTKQQNNRTTGAYIRVRSKTDKRANFSKLELDQEKMGGTSNTTYLPQLSTTSLLQRDTGRMWAGTNREASGICESDGVRVGMRNGKRGND